MLAASWMSWIIVQACVPFNISIKLRGNKWENAAMFSTVLLTVLSPEASSQPGYCNWLRSIAEWVNEWINEYMNTQKDSVAARFWRHMSDRFMNQKYLTLLYKGIIPPRTTWSSHSIDGFILLGIVY